MKVKVEINKKEDFIKLIPEGRKDLIKLSLLGKNYVNILCGGYVDGSRGISLQKL